MALRMDMLLAKPWPIRKVGNASVITDLRKKSKQSEVRAQC